VTGFDTDPTCLDVVTSDTVGEPQVVSSAQATATGNTSPEYATGRVVLVDVDAAIVSRLEAQLEGRISFETLSASRQMLAELEQMLPRVDALLLGVDVREPVRVAQRVQPLGNDIPVLILTEPEHHAQLGQVLRFSPFLGSDVSPWPVSRLDELSLTLEEAVSRAQKRRSYHSAVAASQRRLGNIYNGRLQITHYLDRLLDNAPIGILNVDVHGVILGMNRYAGRMLDRTEREALGVPLANLFPPEEMDTLHKLVASCVAPSKRPAPEVIDISRTAGSVRFLEVMASSLVDRSGQLGATLILQDVTARVCAERERCEAEESLRVSERRYRELVQTMSEALALTDDQHVITYVNESFCSMFGYSSEEAVGRHLLEFVHEEDKQLMSDCMSQAPDAADGVKRYETAWVTRDGRKITTLTSPKRIFDPNAGYAGCLGIFTDITERKQVEEREKKHMLELAHVSRVTTMGEMSSQIAHELAQPLTAIAGLSAGCLKLFRAGAATPEDVEESLSDISQQANRARDIVVRLRNFVRNEEVQRSRIEINELVRGVVPLIEVEARWYSLPVKLDLWEPLPAIMGDSILIEQIVLNLVHNAIEAMHSTAPRRRSLTIRTSMPDENHVQVAVCDSGPGISDGVKARIFDPFFTTKADGMGMGLAITRSIIDAHQGIIEVNGHNEQGGTTFSFTLPVPES